MDSNILLQIGFFATVCVFLFMIYYTLTQSTVKYVSSNCFKIFCFLVVWALLQIILSITGVYANTTNTMPPLLFLFGVLPWFILIGYLFFFKKGKNFIQALPLEYLTNLHIIRIPVEFVLAILVWEKNVPKQMSFFGSNYDIVIGITAPILAFLYFKQNKLGRTTLLIWNFIGLFFLMHIVIIAVLSAPSPLQQLNLDRPNVAILHFPYVLLPTLIVPVVLLSHLVSIKRLWVKKWLDEEATIDVSNAHKTQSLW